MTYQSLSPFDGKLLESFDEISDASFETKLATAQSCFEIWRHTSYSERAVIIGKAGHLLRNQANALARIMTLEMGKRIAEARAEVEFSARILLYYAENAERFLAPVKLDPMHDADRFMAWDEGWVGLDRPIALGGVEIGMANAGCLGLDENLARAGRGDRQFVVALGAGVTAVKAGDRVGVPWLYPACGHCEYCLSAWETVCGEAKFGGYTQNGGFADYLLADPDYVAHIPAGLDAFEAAPLICAGITTYKGLKETQARPGEWVAISGCGGLGHLAIQYAKAMGLKVAGIDIDDGKLAHATKLGADLVINAKTHDLAEMLNKQTGGGAHGVLITAPSLAAFKQGVAMTRKRGTCVLVGLPPGEFPVPLFDVVAKCITVRGSFVGTRRDRAECLAFAADGKVKADVELQPLAAINTVFDRLERGEVPSRVVLDFSDVVETAKPARSAALVDA